MKLVSDRQFFQSLTPETIVLTPNRRLAAHLRKHYTDYQLKQARTVWRTPHITPFLTWLHKTWQTETSQSFDQTPYLLNSLQEQMLWETIVAKTNDQYQLLQVSETAEHLCSAYGLLKQWQVNLEHETSLQEMALKEWIYAFESYCKKRNFISPAMLMDAMITLLEQKNFLTGKQIVLIGFTELSPQMQAFFNCLTTFKNEVQLCQLQTNDTHDRTQHKISLDDFEDEIIQMALWAKSIYEKNKTATIGCVLPTLDKTRDRVIQIFKEVFIEYQNPLTRTLDIINISAGKPLSRYSILNTALHILNLTKKTLPLSFLSHLLFSPFIAGAETEQLARSQFDKILRQHNKHTIVLQELLQDDFLERKYALKTLCPLFFDQLQRFLTILKQMPEQTTCSEWAKIFNQLLLAMGWPGERSVNSEEYQVIEQWLQLLHQFTTLTHLFSLLTYHQAFDLLYRLATKTVFQAQTPDANIQILGLLEAASLPFDYLWVSGLDDMSWPPQPKPHPLIPKKIQRELQMPHATANRELLFCQTLTEQFRQNAKQIIFSHAKMNNELTLQCSALLKEVPEITVAELKLPPHQSLAKTIFLTKQLHYLQDDTAPLISEQESVQGGTAIIKYQALCPFRAFAEHRLHAKMIEETQTGLRAKDRGALIHKILELIWNELQDQTTLLQLSDTELQTCINKHIKHVFATINHTYNQQKKYLTLERDRLEKLIFHWLEVEKKRPYFKILALEKSFKTKLNKLELNVRIDRIDAFENGEQLIIDYKTGKTNDILHWFDERLEEPQLPLYCLIDTTSVAGIAFAQLATGNYAIKGISKDVLDIRGVKLFSEVKKATAQHWPEQVQLWNTYLLKLSDAFYQGDARVDPKNKPDTCEYCSLKSFCRIQEEIFI